MIPSPNLDDRTFDDIVDEAIRLIPQYCPEWTNYNASDPGITLLELFAWMTEMAIYRLNQVPEKNYLAFLNMMGIRLRPPQPARALVHFDISEKIDQVVVPASTRLATSGAADEGSLPFETEEELLAFNNKLVRCMSQYEQQFSDNTPWLEGRRGGFDVFGGARSIERFLYLGDERLSAFTEEAVLLVHLEAQSTGDREFHELLEWEYWDGSRWRELANPSVDAGRNTVAFQGPPGFDKTTVNEVDTFWIRGRLFEVPRTPDETLLDRITARIEVLGEGVEPDGAFANMEGDVFQSLDLDKNFLPLGKAPAIDSTFYVACDDVLGQPDSNIRLDVTLSDQTVADPARPSADLVLRWEYHNGKRWKVLGRELWNEGKVESDHGFEDGTKFFTESGTIAFHRPRDLEAVEINGVEARWIRCRVELGNFGVQGTYELDGETWVWKDEHPLRPPTLKSLTFKFQEESHPFESVFVYNDFVYTDHSAIAAQEYKPFQAFQPVVEESPTLFLGWEAPFPNDACKVYFHVVAGDKRGGRSALRSFHDRTEGDVEQRVVWEYWDGKTWGPLAPRDSTESFTQSGFIQFVGPTNFRKSRRFGESLYWMRARLEMGGYDEPPKVDRILINAVHAANMTTYQGVPLGFSRGLPNQHYNFPNTPVLDGEVILVREPDEPRGEEREALEARYGASAVTEDEDGEGYWVRWSPVESFFDAGAGDRVYVKDVSTGELSFGDGLRGMIPPRGEKNIRAARYQVGGGSQGNVPGNTITVLNQSLAFVNGVANPYPAAGGCDMETVEEAKLRAPHMLKARNRAVTVDDFQWLAMEASNSVARVKCLPSSAREGEVSVIVVPRTALHASLGEKPVPTNELLKKVRAYLAERKLVTTIINVVRPSYVEVSARIEIARLATGASDRIKRDVEREVRKFLHPLHGFRNGKGWPFGRSVLKVDLYHVIEQVDGVDFVDKIRLYDEDTGVEVEQVRLRDDQLVFVVDVTVVEKAHERIV